MVRYYGPLAVAMLILSITLAVLDHTHAWGPWEAAGFFALGMFLVMGMHFWLEDHDYLGRR